MVEPNFNVDLLDVLLIPCAFNLTEIMSLTFVTSLGSSIGILNILFSFNFRHFLILSLQNILSKIDFLTFIMS